MKPRRKRPSFLFFALVTVVIVAWFIVDRVCTFGPPPSALTLAPPLPRPKETIRLFPAIVDTSKEVRFRYLKPGRQVGFIDQDGQVVIEPKFVAAKEFSEGLAPAAIRHVHEKLREVMPLWGYIDESGEFVISPQFYDAGPFSQGLAGVKIDFYADSWGYIDRLGRVVIKPLYSKSPYLRLVSGTPFMGGGVCFGLFARAPIMMDSSSYTSVLIDLGGRVIWEYQQRLWSEGSFQDGLLLLERSGEATYGFVNQLGEMKIDCEPFHAASPFSEGLAAVARYGPKSEFEWGYIDTSGTVRIGCQFDKATPFYEGKAWVKEFSGPWKIIDKNGNEVSDKRFDFESVYPFSEGLALVRDGKAFALIDTDGAVYPLTDPVFRDADFSDFHGFRNGLAELGFTVPRLYIQVYINRSGKVVWRSDQSGLSVRDLMTEKE